MDPAEYPTNALSVVRGFNFLNPSHTNHFQSKLTSIQYENFVPHSPVSTLTKKKLQKLEALWRQEGKLVYRDSIRDRIWVFRSPSASLGLLQQHPDSNNLDPLVSGKNSLDFLRRETGIYEPSILARDTNIPSFTRVTKNGSSPLSFTEASFRKAQACSANYTQPSPSLYTAGQATACSPGMKSDGAKSSFVSSKEIHECFISAVLASMMYLLCRDDKFIPFNSRTLISVMPHSASHLGCPNVVEFCTLDVSLTTLGTLLIKTYLDMALRLWNISKYLDSTTPWEQLEPGASLWLAPSGCAAKFYCILNDSTLGTLESSLAQAPGLNDSTSDIIKTWQSKCLEWLSYKGLNPSIVEAGGWVLAQIFGGFSPYSCIETPRSLLVDGSAIVPWPAKLCFQSLSSNSLQSFQPKIGAIDYRDPLSFAEEWLNSQEERNAITIKRQKERQAAQLQLREREELAARATRTRVISPIAFRRASIPGTIYPTPPDAPHPPTGLTVFNDNVLTSEISNNCAPSETDTSSKRFSEVLVNADVWVPYEKRDPIPTVNFVESYTEDDNIFGPLGGDMFGASITDADFNFFDEPGEVPMDLDTSSPKYEPISSMQEPQTLEDITMLDSSTEVLAPCCASSVAMHEHTNISPGGRIQDDYQQILADHIVNPANLTLPVVSPNIPKVQSYSTKDNYRKETIFNQLKMDLTHTQVNGKTKRPSLYDRVEFSKSLLSIDEKYEDNGRFNFITAKTSPKRAEPASLPRTDYLSNKSRNDRKLTEMAQLARILAQNGTSAALNGPKNHPMDLDCCSLVSEDEISSKSSSDSDQGEMSREREIDYKEDAASSSDILAKESENVVSTRSINSSYMPFIDPDPVDWPTATYFTLPEPDVQSNALSDLDCIAITQILADQAVSGTLQLPNVSKNSYFSALQKSASTKRATRSLKIAAIKVFGDVNVCSFQKYLDVQGIHISNQVLRLPPRPNMNQKSPLGANPKLDKPFEIAPPQLEVRRSDSNLSVLPSAVPFWGNLGLGPFTGVKDVEALCIYPDFEGIAANSDIFLDRMSSVYESSRFGTHNRIMSNEINSGLVPFTPDSSQTGKINRTAIKEVTGELSRSLSCLPTQNKNLVIYFVYIVEDGSLLVHICSAFQHLFNMYRNILLEKRIAPTNDLVLQLVPSSFIASPSSLAIPLPSDYFRLGLEVYDRCTDFFSSTSMPAIILESPLPKSIDLKLTSKPSASLLNENTCLHIAYAQSIDNRWITVAWTDNQGAQQMSASYCLGRKNELITTSIAEVANEVWETTLEFISDKKINWRLMIARVGFMDSSEIAIWTRLASTETTAQIRLTLITIQTQPSLQFLPRPILIGPSGASGPSVVIPASTPLGSQPPARSPENNLASGDTAIDPEIDARLIDFTDQTWGAVLSHRLNNSNSLVETNLALISGYLIKRGGINADDPPIVMEVNIIYSEVIGNPRTYHENLLREVLGYYRGLGTLARARGIVDVIKDVRPWHVAAVEKAGKALYMLM